MNLKSSIEKLMRGENLKNIECENALNEILSPTANPLQMAAFLVLLRAKKETPEELSAIVSSLRNKMIKVPTTTPVLDIVGTGGDRLNTINISTGSAMLAASCGVKIAKHGNRAATSQSGSADVLEALGINIQQSPEQICKLIDEINIAFCFFPNFHPATQTLRQYRKELNVPTTFNILGPLLNPANAKHYIVGVYSESLMNIMADVLIDGGCDHSMIVHGNGMDELNCTGPVNIIEIKNNEKIKRQLDPLEFGLARCTIEDLRGGDAKTNAALLIQTFKGKTGPIADTLILNAGVALYLYGLASSIDQGISIAHENLASSTVNNLLQQWMKLSHEQ